MHHCQHQTCQCFFDGLLLNNCCTCFMHKMQYTQCQTAIHSVRQQHTVTQSNTQCQTAIHSVRQQHTVTQSNTQCQTATNSVTEQYTQHTETYIQKEPNRLSKKHKQRAMYTQRATHTYNYIPRITVQSDANNI